VSSWEYKVIRKDVEEEDSTEILNQVSREGWELVSVAAYGDFRRGIGLAKWWKEYYFKRTVTES